MLTSGLIENIGTDVPDHEVALHMMAEKLEGVLHGRQLQAIGHRVVQGAEKFTHPVLLNEQVIDEIDALSPLAPPPLGSRLPLGLLVECLGAEHCRQSVPQ